MNSIFEPIDVGMVADARNIYSARLLTDPQFEEFVSICAILNREIHRTGSFIEKLGIYAFVISLTQKGISANRAETIIRDLFKALFGQTLDQLRQRLLKTAEELDDESIAMGVPYAYEVLQMIEGDPEPGNDPDPMPFHRAYAHQAAVMATQLSITDVAAKKIISEEFKTLEGRDFYEEGKQFEDRFYQPKIRADKHRRDALKGSNSNRETA
ncbi:conserved hypothetical protein [Roseibium sp. TrichSKD4]|uniref:hypothetical protein n=1 Tax=Roseibium sp. TrichSKD4 TaxID=744980 RepID=UPI0001E5653A|nr:hypothetical protein [Roseibium sp. TrichSKD4]EFO34056.1 conserved hypothetical protein [Roseibium sp. TrichSKD4]